MYFVNTLAKLSLSVTTLYQIQYLLTGTYQIKLISLLHAVLKSFVCISGQPNECSMVRFPETLKHSDNAKRSFLCEEKDEILLLLNFSF